MENTLQRIQFWLLVAIGILVSFNYNSIKLLTEENKVIRGELLSVEEQVAILQKKLGAQDSSSPATR